MSNKYDHYDGKKRRIADAMTSVYKEEHRHLCASCKCAFYFLLRDEQIADWFYQRSTQDPHFCDLYEKTYNDRSIVCATDESGNTRVYLDGFKTVDNGSGYWVIGCPYYEELF